MSTRRDATAHNATNVEMMHMKHFVMSNDYKTFNDMLKHFIPTLELWKLRFYSTAAHFKKDRRFQICLQLANEMQQAGFQPTADMIRILKTMASRSHQYNESLEAAIQSWSTHATHASDASNGGRPKMRRQIRTRSRHRLNKSKKNRRRKVRRTRHNL